MDIAYKVMTGEYKAEGCLARAMYFMNPNTSSPSGALWILKNATFCTTVGNHAFFEPKAKIVKPVVAQVKKKPVVIAEAKTKPSAPSKPITLAANIKR